MTTPYGGVEIASSPTPYTTGLRGVRFPLLWGLSHLGGVSPTLIFTVLLALLLGGRGDTFAIRLVKHGQLETTVGCQTLAVRQTNLESHGLTLLSVRGFIPFMP